MGRSGNLTIADSAAGVGHGDARGAWRAFEQQRVVASSSEQYRNEPIDGGGSGSRESKPSWSVVYLDGGSMFVSRSDLPCRLVSSICQSDRRFHDGPTRGERRRKRKDLPATDYSTRKFSTRSTRPSCDNTR